ncbi:MAG: hypothetical protein ABSB14_15220, partial [Candidatus Sulfotelmatobacter sp.]
HDKRESSPRGVMHDDWCRKLICHAPSLKLAAPGNQHIPHPPTISSISERDQESIRLPKNIYGCVVEPA